MTRTTRGERQATAVRGGNAPGSATTATLPQRSPLTAPSARLTAAPRVPSSQRTADLDVVVLGGAGHVGLPLSLVLAESGHRVGVFDLNQGALDGIAAGRMPFAENGADDLLAQVLTTDRLVLDSDPDVIGRADVVIVVIGTPVDEFLNPSMTVFERAVDQIALHLRDGALVILRSTVYPGTTEYVTEELAARGCHVDVAFCPERIAEGHALEELRSLPQIIGSDSVAAGERAGTFFASIGLSAVHTSSREAELAKLLTNTWRYMKFAVANQFLLIAHQAGLDYGNVLDAIRRDYPRAKDLPTPGFAAGPCLFKDAMQLSAFTKDHFPMGQAAMQVNEGMPAYIVSVLKARHGSLRGRTIGILGMAFKAESDDTRSSLAFKLRKLLAWEGARVLCSDPYVNDPRMLPLDEVLGAAETVVIGAPHRPYRSLELGDREVVDIWDCLGNGYTL